MQNNFSVALSSRVAVVIPCYKVSTYILDVIQNIGQDVDSIFVVDDCCPEKTGALVESACTDSRVRVIYNRINQGVGGAVMAGYKAAIADRGDVIVKIDGDGQMDPALISDFIAPILAGEADYTKGNRFFFLEEIRAMPKLRVFGNAVLSFMTKLSSGYWDLFDPNNGYTAIHAGVARHLPFEKISRGYFFESDMLFRLNTLRAVVVDVAMDARYGNEVSNLKISKILGTFLFKHVRNFFKRIFYNYYLRDMSLASIELPLGIVLLIYGCIFGAFHWMNSLQEDVATPAGTVMLAALPVLMGTQLIIAFLSYDIANVPKRPVHKLRRIFKKRPKSIEEISDGK
ncbi:MAG: glycosyltransferase family 2 protein [Methylococcales bacterium]